jgi:hypothetical protein
MKFSHIFGLVAEQMMKQLEFIKAGVDESELKKRARETVVRNFLEPFIPDTMGICSGVVISTNDKSGEIDLIIYDKKGLSLFKPFLWYYPESSKPIPAEVVYAVVEVENKLDKDKTLKCLEKIKKVKELPKVAYYKQSGAIIETVTLYGKEWEYFPTLGIIFAFDGNPEEIREILTHVDYPLEHRIDLVCLLQKGLITYYDSKNNLLVFPPEPNSDLVYRKGSSEENLKILYLMLTRIFSQAWTRPIRVMDYFKV